MRNVLNPSLNSMLVLPMNVCLVRVAGPLSELRNMSRKRKDQERRDEINRKARERYWKPENVEKRRQAKIKREREAAELTSKQLAEIFRIVSDVLGNRDRLFSKIECIVWSIYLRF